MDMIYIHILFAGEGRGMDLHEAALFGVCGHARLVEAKERPERVVELVMFELCLKEGGVERELDFGSKCGEFEGNSLSCHLCDWLAMIQNVEFVCGVLYPAMLVAMGD